MWPLNRHRGTAVSEILAECLLVINMPELLSKPIVKTPGRFRAYLSFGLGLLALIQISLRYFPRASGEPFLYSPFFGPLNIIFVILITFPLFIVVPILLLFPALEVYRSHASPSEILLIELISGLFLPLLAIGFGVSVLLNSEVSRSTKRLAWLGVVFAGLATLGILLHLPAMWRVILRSQ